MGWNSWNCFGVDVREADVRATVDYVADHLRPYGWEYVVVDAGWYLAPGVTTANFKQPRPGQRIDVHGRLEPAPHKFPSSAGGQGFRPLADYVHRRGLKFGLHIMRGVPWQAVDADTPLHRSTLTARQVAKPDDTCPWYQGMLGLQPGAGALAYYRSLVELYAQWEVDFVKADDIAFPYHREELAALSQAVQESPRPMLLSLSPGPAPVGEADQLADSAHLWRISPDFWDDWRLLHRQFSLCRAWQGRAPVGRWPDCDMLPIGKLRITGPDDYSVSELGLGADELTNEYSRFSPVEARSLFTLWAMFRSPLFLGGYLPENDAMTKSLVTHSEVIGINQESTQNREVYFDDATSVWSAQSTCHSGRYLAVFNLLDPDGKRAHPVRWRDLGLSTGCQAREVWTGDRLFLDPAALATGDVPPHGVRLYCLDTTANVPT